MSDTNRKDRTGSSIVDLLFETGALEVCPAGKPFFYTSGKLGPYYINTHYLYGSKEEAETFLSFIESQLSDPEMLPAHLAVETILQYNSNSIYRTIVDRIARQAEKLDYDFISGGERRDFFFSVPVAYLLDKPHLSIFKDGTTVYSDHSFRTQSIEGQFNVQGLKCLHIADLVTEASSYTRAWLPSIRRLGADMAYTIAVIDRNQGGRQILRENGVEFFALAGITEELFVEAERKGCIQEDQLHLIQAFLQDPARFMLDFFTENPDFLQQQIALGGKAKERALRCIENRYHLPGEQP